MVKSVLSANFAIQHGVWRVPVACPRLVRPSSSSATPTYTAPSATITPPAKATVPLSRLSTSVILRNLFLSAFFTKPLFFKVGLACMKTVADSESAFLNPDKNPILRGTVKRLIYDQFCAGRNEAEVDQTSRDIKELGFSGVVLCYGKEMYAEHAAEATGEVAMAHLKQWKEGNLQTLKMAKEGDWLGIKITGAGPLALNAMINNQPAPAAFSSAMHEICAYAQSKGARIWIDAEQQAVQTAIDIWTIDLMREWNRGPSPVIYNTIQAYLKASRPKLEHQLRLARDEGWTLAIKLVRGAYMSHDQRDRIHDTKADTDASYEGIVHDMLTGTVPGFTPTTFPRVAFLLAGHNSQTIRKALTLAQNLARDGKLQVRPEFAQLQGMADDIGCEIAQVGEQMRSLQEQQGGGPAADKIYVPRVYKCLTWGSLTECMQYLVRRAVENSGATERIGESRVGFSNELRRRIWAKVGVRA